MRTVTEEDFRQPQYRGAKPEDYEFRSDGRIARKDRWEQGIRQIASALGYDARSGFEIEHVVYSVETLIEAAKKADIDIPAFDELPE